MIIKSSHRRLILVDKPKNIKNETNDSGSQRRLTRFLRKHLYGGEDRRWVSWDDHYKVSAAARKFFDTLDTIFKYCDPYKTGSGEDDRKLYEKAVLKDSLQYKHR